MSETPCKTCGAVPDARGNVTHFDPDGPEARVWRIEAARVEAVRAFGEATGWDFGPADFDDILHVLDVFDTVRAYLDDDEMTGPKTKDVTALHYLALLLAAMTEPT